MQQARPRLRVQPRQIRLPAAPVRSASPKAEHEILDESSGNLRQLPRESPVSSSSAAGKGLFSLVPASPGAWPPSHVSCLTCVLGPLPGGVTGHRVPQLWPDPSPASLCPRGGLSPRLPKEPSSRHLCP